MRKILTPLLIATSCLFASPTLAAGWVSLTAPSNTGSTFVGLSFYKESGIAVSSLDVMYTNDGGTSWIDSAFSGDIWGTNMKDVVMTSTTHAVAVGNNGTILETNDGGASWTSVASGTSRSLHAVDAYGSTLYVVGAQGTVLTSTDSGASWTDVSFGETRDFLDVDIVSSSIVWVVGEGGAAYERVEGVGWWTVEADTTVDLQAVTGVGTSAWIAGEDEYLATIESLGTVWSEIVLAEQDLGDSIDDLLFVSATEGYLTRLDGCIWQSTDAGANWSSMSGTCGNTYTRLAAADDALFAAGYSDEKIIQVYDDEAPTVSTVSTTSATVDVVGTVSVTATDEYGIASCTLLVNGASAGTMSQQGTSTTYAIAYAFTTVGNLTLAAQCTDNGGNVTTGASIEVDVESETVLYDIPAGELIKTACSEGYTVNDPCTAVYYVTLNGQRHAFPNEKVYYSWYSDFDDVVIVDASTMASFTLGRNVTYKPGVTMVKFQTVNTVYAVEAGGVLRAVGNEAIAASLYGSDWNTQDVDDISDAFYGNYSFGAYINSADDYDIDAVLTGTATIEENY